MPSLLSASYIHIKHLRSTGATTEAIVKLRSAPPRSDIDAFEAAICLFICSEFGNCLHVCQTYTWRAPWAMAISQALMAYLQQDAIKALGLARTAISHQRDMHDVNALYLMLLIANQAIDEADQFVQKHYAIIPMDEPFLLTMMAELAIAVSDWKQAYRCASAVVAADPEDFRGLMSLSIVNLKIRNPHESLGNALRARLINRQSQQAVLQLMRCYNELGDFYAAVGDFDQLDSQIPIAADLYVELGIAYIGLSQTELATTALTRALEIQPGHPTAVRELLMIHGNANDSIALQQLMGQHQAFITNDMVNVITLGFERLAQGDTARALGYFNDTFALSRQQNVAYNELPWPVPEPRLRHDYEQLQLLAQRQKLDSKGLAALQLLEHYCKQSQDIHHVFAPTGAAAETLQRALTDMHYIPTIPFDDVALSTQNHYPDIEQQYIDGKPAMVVIDNFLSPAALQALRQFSEEATVWKLNNDRGYVGALLGQGFASPVLIQIAHELKSMMPQVIGDYPLLQAWGFKYDQRLSGINMHADFAKINVNFWITPDAACADPNTGGMVIYDVPAPGSWTFADYNVHQSKMKAYLKVHKAESLRVPYRENRCVIFDSSLIHITDELHFKPGYQNRRINVTLLYGRARSVG